MSDAPITPKIRAFIAACESAGLGAVSVNISVQELKQLLAENHGCPDIPDDDGTPDAHPAFWRGQTNGVEGAVETLEKVLNGGDDGAGVFANKRLESLRRRLLTLRTQRWPRARGGHQPSAGQAKPTTPPPRNP